MCQDRIASGAIFDLDGVIADTGWAHRQAWAELAAACGVGFDDELFVRTFGMQNYQIVPIVLGRSVDGDELARLSSWKEQRYRQIVSAYLRPPEGLLALLQDLKTNGFRLAIGSSAPPENIELVLGRLGIADAFEAVVHGGMVGRGKPAPDTFLLAAGLLGVPVNRAVVVEDAVAGIEAAKAAGMPVIAITTTRPAKDLAGADMVVDRLSQLSAKDFMRLIQGRSGMTA